MWIHSDLKIGECSNELLSPAFGTKMIHAGGRWTGSCSPTKSHSNDLSKLLKEKSPVLLTELQV